jgi:PAS domain S-box-containing protein
VAVAAGFGLRLALTAWVGPGLPTYVTFYPAVMAAALLAGFGSGLVATAFSGLTAAYWLLPQEGLAVTSPVDRLGLATFTFMGLFMSVVAEMNRRSRDKVAAYDREAVLRESRERLAVFAEATFEGVVESQAGRLVDCNEQFARMLGYSVAELRGMEIAELIAPEDRDRVMANIRLGRESAIEHGAVRKDGTRIVVEARGQPMIPGSARRHTAIRDITNRTRAEEAQRVHRELLEAVVAHLPAAVAVIRGSDLRIQLVNPAYQGIAPGKEMLGKTLDEVWPETQRALVALCRQVLATGEPHHAVDESNTIQRSPGGPLDVAYFSWSLHRVRMPGDENWAILNTAWETTERKRSEQALRRAHEQLALAQQSARAGMWDWDLTTEELEWSPQMFHLFGFDPAPAKATFEMWHRTLHPEDRNAAEETVRAAVQNHVRLENEYRIVLASGEVRWISALGDTVYDAGGRPLRMSGICVNITALKHAEEQLRASLAEKEVLLKEIHHRVKNNMQVISSLVALQAERAVLQDVTHRVRSMALVHEKLYQSADMAHVEFGEYARSLLNYLWRAHGTAAPDARLDLDLESVPLPVNAAVPCGLILNELASNALKHAFRGRADGVVAVSLHAGPEGRVCLRVRDNGTGLPAGLDWRQADSLGLRLVQMLAGQLHATVEVTGQEGTEFAVTFSIQ